jgi:hypothetical protein
VLTRASLAYVLMGARASQLDMAHLERLSRMADGVSVRDDIQRFIGVHSSEGGTLLRYTALKLLPLEESQHINPRFSPLHFRRNQSANSAVSSGSNSSPERERVKGRGGFDDLSPRSDDGRLPSLVFEEGEDGDTVEELVRQLFDGGATVVTAKPARVQALMENPPPPPPPLASGDGGATPRGGVARHESFDWEVLAAHVGGQESPGPKTYSTADERRRFFDRILSGPDPAGRSAFCHVLNQQRSQSTDVGAGFEDLASIMWKLLSHCQRHDDVHNAKMAMMLSQTFWHTRSGSVTSDQGGSSPARPPPAPSEGDEKGVEAGGDSGGKGEGDAEGGDDDGSLEVSRGAAADRSQREYLSKRLLNHPLWVSDEFWDQALWQCVLEQIPTIEQTKSALWHDLAAHARDELVTQVHNIIFSQAGALAHSMVEFGVAVPEAANFVARVADRHQLSESQRFMLLKHISRHRIA